MTALTVKDLSGKWGISGRRVRYLISIGRLPAVKFGNTWVINSRDIRGRKPGGPGRPKKTTRRRGLFQKILGR